MFRNIVNCLSLISILFTAATAMADESVEYPKIVQAPGGTLKIHHPVINAWPQFSTLDAWIPVEVRLDGQDRDWIGSVRATAQTRVDLEKRQVLIYNQRITDRNFSADNAPAQVLQITEQAISDKPLTVALDVVLHSLADDFEVPSQGAGTPRFSFDPPRIVVTKQPMQLLLIDKEPVQALISGTDLEFVVNTDWRVFYHPESRDWYVLNDGAWQRSSILGSGGWTTTDEIPQGFRELALGDRWPRVQAAYPPTIPAVEPVPFFVSLEPTELVVINGEPGMAPIEGTGMAFVANTERDLFRLGGNWYLLASGRWFQSRDLEGRWQPVSELPAEFAAIPDNHPRASVRAWVPGTVESMVALMEAAMPRWNDVALDAGAGVTVGYVGQPMFEPIDGTALARAVNSPLYVFAHNNYFYLCHDAAWYFSRRPEGPWEVALSIPDELHSIPASDPGHRCAYLNVASEQQPEEGKARFEYNAGYLGEYTDKVVISGTGWYYSPWLWNDPRGFPVYWSHPWSYGWGYGRYAHPWSYYGGYWGQQTVTLSSNYYSVPGSTSWDPAFQDPNTAQRGSDYSTLAEQRETDGMASLNLNLNASDDLYTDEQGNVYKRSDEGWSQRGDSDWNTMAEMERQYGVGGDNSLGQAQYQPEQRQAYQQNERDQERMERYYRNRQKGYNMHMNVYVGR